MAEVILREVSKVYPGGVKAVDRFTLDIRDGEFVVFVGPSGCGKSTTLRMIAGLEEITEGAIRIGDRIVNDVAPKDRDIAMVFQNYALYPHMSVYDNMAFSLKMRRRQLGLTRADIDRKVAETAEILGITDLLKRRPRELSGGQRQRVAVGRAIVRNPRAFLFDEPLSNLDAKLRGEMRAELKRLHRRLATTTIYVTHDQEEAMTLGDRVVVMRDGLIQQCGPPLDVYERPVNRFVGGFLGSPPMNFLAGHVRRGAGGLVFDEGSGVIGLPEPLARRVESRVGDALVLGVRPEAIRFNADGQREAARCGCGERLHGRFCHMCGRDNGDWAAPDGAAMLTAKVLVVEPLGEDLDVVMTTAAKGRLVARVDARTNVREGQDVPVYIDMRGTHMFEPGDAGANVVLAADLEAGRVS